MAPPSKATFTVEGTTLVLKVKTGGRVTTWTLRNSYSASKWAETLLEVAEEVVGPFEMQMQQVEREEPPRDHYSAIDENGVEYDVNVIHTGPPPLSEEESRRRELARIATFTTNDGVTIRPGIKDPMTEEQILRLPLPEQLPQPDVQEAVPMFPEYYANRPVVSPNDAKYLPKSLDG
jgi:hypothetical protein